VLHTKVDNKGLEMVRILMGLALAVLGAACVPACS
jgi:hypothetical protein